jgi:hypothetical protein
MSGPFRSRSHENPSLLLTRVAGDAKFYVHGENILKGNFTYVPFTTVVRNTAGVVLEGNAKTGTYSYAGGTIATLDVIGHGFTAADNGTYIPVHFLTGLPSVPDGAGVTSSGNLQMTYVNPDRITVITTAFAGGTTGNVSLEYRRIRVPAGYRFVRCRAQVLWMYDHNATNKNVCPLWVSMGMLLNGVEEAVGTPGADLTALGPPEWMTYHNTGDSGLIAVTEGDLLSVVSLIGFTYGDSCYIDRTTSTYFEIEFIE